MFDFDKFKLLKPQYRKTDFQTPLVEMSVFIVAWEIIISNNIYISIKSMIVFSYLYLEKKTNLNSDIVHLFNSALCSPSFWYFPVER